MEKPRASRPIYLSDETWRVIDEQARTQGIDATAYVEGLIEIGIQDAPSREWDRERENLEMSLWKVSKQIGEFVAKYGNEHAELAVLARRAMDAIKVLQETLR